MKMNQKRANLLRSLLDEHIAKEQANYAKVLRTGQSPQRVATAAESLYIAVSTLEVLKERFPQQFKETTHG